jgi:predicted nucleic acid-binding protein
MRSASSSRNTPTTPLRLANLRATTALRLPGCCALDTALSNSAALATFDRALADAARRRNVAVVH